MNVVVNMEEKQTYKNVYVNILAFIIQFLTNFFIAPIIVEHVGAAAYGFVNIANDFVSYAAILGSIFNSVAARFIANEIYRKNYEKANNYFNSLIMANAILSLVICSVAFILIFNLEYILIVPESLVTDVKITFVLVFVSYVITLVTMVYSTSVFVVNRTDIQGIRNVLKSILALAVTILLFIVCSVKIYWVAFGTVVSTIIIAVMNISLTHKYTPMLKLNIGYIKKKYALEVAKSGGWMAITSLSAALLRGVDLTLANIMLGDYEMGLLSVARTMPNNMLSVIGTLAPIFTPVFIACYASGKQEALIKNINRSIDIMSMILFVPISIFIVYSSDFYKLWQDSLGHEEVYIVSVLSIVSVIQSYFDATTATLAQVSVVVNKLKIPVLVSLGCGIISLGIEIILLKFTNLGIYAIVLPTTIIMVMRYIFFNPIYASYCLNISIKSFLGVVVKRWGAIPILVLSMVLVKCKFQISNWGTLILNICVCYIVGEIIMVMLYKISIVKKIIGLKNEK